MTEPNGGFSLNQILSKVRNLTQRAEHPETPTAEAEACRTKAEAMMLKYAIDQAMLRQSQPADLRVKPTSTEFATAGGDINGYVERLLYMVVRHCRCIIGPSRYDREQRTFVYKVYGYEHDLRFCEVLYTTLRLHMLGALRPKIDPNETLGQNVYRLHQAGYDWREVADMYGYVLSHQGSDKFIRKDDRGNPDAEKIPYLRIVGKYRTEYRKEAARRGESHTTIRHSSTYREDAADGYITQLKIRIRDLERKHSGTGTELVLAKDDLEQWVREQDPSRYTKCPKCEKLSASPFTCDQCGYKIQEAPPPPPPCKKCQAAKSGHCRDHPGYTYRWRNRNQVGYDAGRAHANTADLTGNNVSTIKREIN